MAASKDVLRKFTKILGKDSKESNCPRGTRLEMEEKHC